MPVFKQMKKQKNDNTLSNWYWLISLINKNRSQRNNQSGTSYRGFTNKKTRVYSGLQVTLDNISSPQKKRKPLSWTTQTDCPFPSVQFIYCAESVCAVGAVLFRYEWLMCRLYTSTSPSLSFSLFPVSDTYSLSLSVCLALSLPPTTHSVLYKSYINASSTTFWRWASHNRTFSESHCTQQKYLHNSLTSESYTVWCIWTRINNHKQHELSISEECTQQYWCMHRGDTNTYSVKRFEFDMMLLHRSSIHKIRNVLFSPSMLRLNKNE